MGVPFKHRCVWLVVSVLLLLDSCVVALQQTVDGAKCVAKDNCQIIGHYGGATSADISSTYEQKINNNSFKIYATQTIINNKTTARNLTSPTHISQNLMMTTSYAVTTAEDDLVEAEKVMLYNLRRKLLEFTEPFDASRNTHASSECRLQTLNFLRGLQNFDLWALRMHDSTGRMSSGILNGNINQLGDFDQCLNIQTQNSNVQGDNQLRGQYCLAYAQPEFSYKSSRLQNIFELIKSHGPFKSEFNDPGHRVPRYSLVNWGICVPSACSPQDVEYTVKEYLNAFAAGTGLSFKVRVEPNMCQVREPKPWDKNTTWAVRFFVVILTITLLSTIYEHISGNDKTALWTAFSLKKNSKWLFSTNSSPNDIQSVHGIRFLNALMLLFSHKSMAMFFNPYNNRTEMSESLGRPWTVIGRAASLYTDPFLLFSGMLTAYSLFGRLLKGQPIRLRDEYISRLMRIVPPLAALILFCTFVLPMWGSGPQWNLVVGHHADICKRNWWRNLLFIHNYFGFSEMCLTHTHHLGIDTELFFISPLLILCIWRWPRKGLYALLILCGVGTAARYLTTIFNELSNYIYFGTNIQRLFRTADYMYSFPPMRSTVYIMGIILGYILRKHHNVCLSKTQLRVGWSIAVICVLASLLGPAPMGDMNYKYNSTHAAIYAAFAPIAWCLFFSWIVFVAQNGYTNFVTEALSWRGFQISTKLSYAIYLTQFPVFFYNVGNRRHIHHYYNFVSIILDTNEFISIFLASVALTLLFDAPFQNLKKLIFNRTTPKTINIERITKKVE